MSTPLTGHVFAPLVLGVVLSAGCGRTTSEGRAGTNESVPAVATGRGVVALVQPNEKVDLVDDDVPVAEDFIDEATNAVTKDNYKLKLDVIEKEILSE